VDDSRIWLRVQDLHFQSADPQIGVDDQDLAWVGIHHPSQPNTHGVWDVFVRDAVLRAARQSLPMTTCLVTGIGPVQSQNGWTSRRGRTPSRRPCSMLIRGWSWL